MDSLLSFITSSISYVGPFVLLMGSLVFIHEMGHFLMAKYFGVRVEVFSLGFGKTLYQFTKGDTTYKLCLIPLGGYVKMFGDDPTKEVSPEDQKVSFLHKSVWQRIAVVLAGPLMNFFIAIPIFALILVIGHKTSSSQLGDISSESFAYKSGLRSGDTITHINNQDVQSWEQLDKIISKNFNKTVLVAALSSEGEQKQVSITIPKVENDKLFKLSKYIGKIDGINNLSKSALIGVKIGSVAHQSGLRSMDQILTINDKPVSYWRNIEPMLIENQNKEMLLTVKQYSSNNDLPVRQIKLQSVYSINGGRLLDSLGIEETSTYVLTTGENSPARQAGFKTGDKILAINGAPVNSWQDILTPIKSFKESDKKIDFLVSNSDPASGRTEAPVTLSVTPSLTQLMNHKMQDEKRFTVGIYSDSTYEPNATTIIKTANPITALKYGLSETINWTKIISIGIYKMVTNQVSSRNITGIITIGKIAGDSYKMGFDFFLKIMGLISVNLFLLNLLPIPVLDGGHLVFYTIEAIKGSPLSVKKMQMAQQFGFLLLMSLMIFAFYNDIKNLINPPF